MSCYEKHCAAHLSSSRSLNEDEVEVAAMAAASNRLAMAHNADAYASPTLPPLRPIESAASPQGLSRYLQGLAAGDDLAELIHGLHRSISACYHGCMRKSKSASCTHTGSTTESHLVDGGVPSQASAPTPTTPHALPHGTLSASERRQFWSAAKTAFLFAAESSSATEAATVLHCSPETRSVLFPYYYPGGDADTTRSPTALPLTGVLRGGDMRMILSDARMAELAREEVRHNPQDGWQQALRLLRNVAPTPLTCAVELEVYRRTNGYHWAEALRCLWAMPPTQWTEMDVGSVLRCLYHAGRGLMAAEEEHTTLQPAASTPAAPPKRNPYDEDGERYGGDRSKTSAVLLARLIAQALLLHRTVEEIGALQWSTPSSFNDTLGLIAQDRSAWQNACLLLDKLLAARVGDAADAATPAAPPPRDEMAGDVVSSQRLSCGVTSAQASSALYQLVRPNAVTVHQICRALQHQWATGLRYVQLLQAASSASIQLVSDVAATEDVLRLCIAGQRWQEALALVEARHAAIREARSTAPARAISPSAFSPASRRGAVTAELPGSRLHYRPDVFVQVVRLLGSVPAARHAAYTLVQTHDTVLAKPLATTSAPTPHSTGASPPLCGHRVDLGRSKHYNLDTLSRAYNCLLQGSATLDAAVPAVRQLNQHYGGADGSATLLPTTRASAHSSALNEHDAALAGLETESVAHIAYLCCVAGDWQRALHHTNVLLHAPRYQATFIPTTRLHDAVQYALEQAPPPGPPWEVSMKLFTDMMERDVPNSEVSFQSVVKRCFAGGAPGQAQRLFRLVLRKGVRS